MIRFWGAISVVVIGIIANFTLAPKEVPFQQADLPFSAREIIEQTSWLEGAPVILANNFLEPVVSGIDYSFNFREELAIGYGVEVIEGSSLDYREESITYSDFVQATTYPFCEIEGFKYCQLDLVWDGDDSEFVVIRVDADHFAIIQSSLLARLE